ncbi:hypothetical protein FS837_010096, partial [Tulasnella sp. UAMH 9824]
MEAHVAPDVLSKLSQVLSNLVLGDNELRRNAEKALYDEWLAKDPGNVLMALAWFARQSPDVHMRGFCAVLLRRLAFRTINAPSGSRIPNNSAIYDGLPVSTIKIIEAFLLDCIANETETSTRNKVIDTATVFAEESFNRHRPWPEMQAFAAQYTTSQNPVHREIAFQIFAYVPRLILDQPVNAIIGVLERGLAGETIPIQLNALKASSAFLTTTDKDGKERGANLIAPMLNTLPPLPKDSQEAFLQALIPLASTDPQLFRPHLTSLISFLPTLITRAPSHDSSSLAVHAADLDEDPTRYAALELLISITENDSKAVQACSEWVPTLVQCCLQGLAEIYDDVDGDWLNRDPTVEGDEDGYPTAFEQALDRAAVSVGASILPVTFQVVPAMLNSPIWQQRHAGLMAICSVAEGTAEFMEKDLGSVINLIVPLFNDPHPRVRTGACHCVGVLCSDLGEVLQQDYSGIIMPALILALNAPEPRVHTHAGAALVNFCHGASEEAVKPYLQDIVRAILEILNASQKSYEQHQAFTTLAMVADAARTSFLPFYPSIFGMAKDVLRKAASKSQRPLRCRVMECAALVACAVGKKTFKADVAEFMNLLFEIEDSARSDPDEENEILTYLLSTYAKVASTLGASFAPYLPRVMPQLLSAAATKQEMKEYSDDEEDMDEKGDYINLAEAFEHLVVISSSLKDAYADWVKPTLEISLPGLKFFWHEGVRESSAMLVPMLLACGKSVLTATDLQTIFRTLLAAIGEEGDTGYLASLYKSVVDSILVLPSKGLPVDLANDIVATVQRKLQSLAQKRKRRAEYLLAHASEDVEEEREGMALEEEMEDFVLDEVGRLLRLLDPNHPYLIM